ncbi:uncharacterized protein LOC141696028 [Apium graveolens]|uniref:uncharacterized protein LOC141696028 n=1 Tax=Apium graveolens TaxID=4045 RepID=UPI003D7B21A0
MDNTTQMILDIMQAEEEEEHDARMRVAAVHLHYQRQRVNSIQHHGGSIMNHRVINRNREECNTRLYHDYYSDTPTYTETQFRRRFRMRRSLFLRIEEAVVTHDYYFTQRTDVVGVRGLSSLQKMTAALRMLAYGTTSDVVDDYVRIGESTIIESLRRFVKSIVEIFGAEYLRRPNEQDVSRLLAENEQRGFPGMLGSLNDINVLDRSHLFEDLAECRGSKVKYTINGNEYDMGYYLADGIYPSWPIFVKTIPKPQACVILHNMIIEDERESSLEEEHFDSDVEISVVTRIRNHHNLREFIQVHQQIRNKPAHFQLQNDLIKYLRQIHGGDMN